MDSDIDDDPAAARVDALDLALLHALELRPRAPFSRIGAALGVSDRTAARRYRRLRTTAGLRVTAMRCATAEQGFEHWMLRLRCTPGGASAIAEALAKRPDTTWVGRTSGGTEVMCSLHSRTRSAGQELLLGKLPRTPQIVEVRAQQMMHRFWGGPDGWLRKSAALSPAQAALLGEPAETAEPGPLPRRLTAEDEALIAALEEDGRTPYADLCRLTGRSEQALRRRLALLLAAGLLYLDVDVDSNALGRGSAAMLSVTAAPHAVHAVGEALAGHPEVAFAAAVTGPSNLMATVVTSGTADLYRYLSRTLGPLAGVEHIETLPFVRLVKSLTGPGPFRA